MFPSGRLPRHAQRAAWRLGRGAVVPVEFHSPEYSAGDGRSDGGELLAATRPAAREDIPAAAGFHSSPEAALAHALDIALSFVNLHLNLSAINAQEPDTIS